MTLELWQLACVCGAIGVVCLMLRQWLRALNRRQMQRLASDARELQACWDLVADLPGTLLDLPLRRTLGRIMDHRLANAHRLQLEHPFLEAERARIARFVAEAPAGAGPRSATDKAVALDRLLGLLQQPECARLIPAQQRIAAEATVSRHLGQLRFLRDQRASVERDHLRRLTRALGTRGSLRSQLSGGSSALPTQ